MDGVVYNSDQPIPGAADAIRWVQSQQIPHLFVTNTTSRARAALVEKLERFGISAHESAILSPAVAFADWLRANGPGNLALFLRSSTRSEFDGLPMLPDNAEQGASYVVIGDLGDLWDFRTLNRAFRLLHHNPEAKLVALGMTRYWLASDGISLDVAPFVAALEHATGRKPMIFGKPAAAFFEAASAKLALPAKNLVMIGDDIHSDIAGAQDAGLRAILVRTGKFRPADLDLGIRPDAVIESVAALPDSWDRLNP